MRAKVVKKLDLLFPDEDMSSKDKKRKWNSLNWIEKTKLMNKIKTVV